MRGLGCGKAIKDPRGLGPGPFSEKHLPREGGVLVQLQVGGGKTPGPCLQRPPGLLLRTGLVRVRLLSMSYPEGKLVGPAPLVQMPFGDPLFLWGRRWQLGGPSGVTCLLGQQGWCLPTKSP